MGVGGGERVAPLAAQGAHAGHAVDGRVAWHDLAQRDRLTRGAGFGQVDYSGE